MEDGRLQVVKVDALLGGVVAVIVRAAVGDARFDAGPGEEECHRVRIMVAPIITLANRRAAELCSPEDQRVLQQPSRLQIGEQPGNWFVDFAGDVTVIILQTTVGVPVTLTALHESYAGLGVSARHQALPAEVARLRISQAVKFLRRFSFVVDILNLRRGCLHAEGELERVDTRLQFVVVSALAEMFAVHFRQQVEFAALMRERFAVAIDERNLRLVDRRRVGAYLHPVIVRRQKCRRPCVHSAVRPGRLERDVAGQILVLKTKPVVEPRSHRRADKRVRAGVQLQQSGAVPGVRAVHRLDEAQLLRHRRDVRP